MEKLVTNHLTKIVAALLLLHLAILYFVQYTAWPEMLGWPYLITQGWLPYKDIAIAHSPLLLYLLSFFYQIFGVGIVQLKAFTWIIVLFTDLLVYLISSRLWNKKLALFTLLIFIPLQVMFQGNALWFDLLLSPLYLLVFFFIQHKKFITAGVFFALALLAKQTSAWMVFPIAISLYFAGKKNIMELEKRYVPLAFGSVLVLLTFVVILYGLGILGYFAYWGIEFGIFTLPSLPGQIDLPSIKQLIVSVFPFIPIIFLPIFYKKKLSWEIFIWTLFALMGTYPRWELFHFQPALPFAAIGISLLLTKSSLKKKTNFFIYRILVLIFSVTVTILFGRYMLTNLNKEARFYESSVQKVVQKVDEYSDNDDYIYVANYWDSIYALTHNQPSTRPLIPYIPWYLDYNSLGEVISEDLQADLPEVIVVGQFGEGLSSYRIGGLENILDRYYKIAESVETVKIYTKNQ